jgi:hypothetical protein
MTISTSRGRCPDAGHSGCVPVTFCFAVAATQQGSRLVEIGEIEVSALVCDRRDADDP